MANELTYQSVFTGQEMDERFTAVAQLQAALLEVETALSAKYVKPASGIPETDLDSAVQSALAKARSAVQDLSNYYTKTEIDSLLAAVNSQEYVDVATLPTASASTLGKIYLVGPTNNQYDRYYTSYDGSAYSWVAAGSTEINLSNYATKAELNQLDQEVDEIVDEYINTPLSQSGTTRYYIKTDVAVGETVDLTEVMSGSYANFKHYIEDCVPGDVFIINGTGTASGELWCFIDSSNKKISSSGGVAGSDLSKTAPAGAAKIIINDRTGNGTQYKRAKGLLAQINDELDQHDAAISSMQSEVSNVGTELEELEHKVGTNNYDNAEFSASYLIWATSSNVVVASSSSYANQRILVPIAVQEGDTVNITQEVFGEAKKAIFADSSDNVIAEVTYQGSVTNYIVPSGATRLYINRKYGATFSCRIQSAYSVKLDSIVNASELPIYAPLPQVAADGQNGSVDAENSTSTDIYNKIDAAIANYGSYAFGEVLGKDATNTYDIKRYSLCRADLFAWRASGPFYAWEKGGVTYYIESCSPYAGMDIYDAARENVVATVASYGAASGTMKDNNNQQYTRKAVSDIAPDIIYTIREVFTFDYDIYTKAGTVVTRLSKTTWDSDTNTISYNSKSYIRSRVDDWGRNTKATIVLWANEHAAQSDPHEPAIVCYRLICDLCQSGPSGNKFLSFLKNFCKVFIIPVVNPYGLNNYAVSKNTAGRLNGNGVNLNRNYPTVGWTQDSGANYGGAYGGSEIEVQYVINTCIEFGANVGIDIHCLGYTTEANEGVCAYGGNNMISSDAGKKDIDRVINSMLSDFSIKLQNYGEASATGEGEGKNWLLANGIEGGLIEMNAGPYALQYDGKQHSGFILGADYTLLLRLLNLWSKRYNEDLALSNFEIS